MPADHPLEQPALAGLVEGAEEERVHDGERPGAHGEDVAQDAPHPGRRPLVRLDGRGVVVALDPDGHGDAVAGVDHPGVLARARPARAAPSVGSRRRWTRDDLYEQCSLHMTA